MRQILVLSEKTEFAGLGAEESIGKKRRKDFPFLKCFDIIKNTMFGPGEQDNMPNERFANGEKIHE